MKLFEVILTESESPGRPITMKNETIAIHGGFAGDPTTKAVAVPIYQTVSYTPVSFDDMHAMG